MTTSLLRDMATRDVYLVFKTHLDVGFTDFARRVVRRYFDVYIPKALSTAEALRRSNSPCGFVWTTGSWLICEFLESATRTGRQRMERAILRGDIAWHALPFTTHSELMDVGLFEFGLSLSQKLDRRFGKKTVAAKMTDVPGHTRSIVPLLADAGVKFLHVGVNSASCPPSVPELFVWRESNRDVIVMYSAAGYGQSGIVPAISSALVFAHTGDNLGPQSPEEVAEAFSAARVSFPEATVKARRLDDFALKLQRIKKLLPVVTREIGDTWIHGVGTDPKKVAQFRELLRLRALWTRTGRVTTAGPRLERFSRRLLVVPEHTWGMDEKTHLADYTRYNRKQLAALRRTKRCTHFEASWAEQRRYVTDAVRELGSGPLASEARTALSALRPRMPDLSDLSRLNAVGGPYSTPHFDIGFDPRSGAIDFLRDRRTGRLWASKTSTLAGFFYELFGTADYARFRRRYLQHSQDWAVKDFTKPGMERAAPRHAIYRPSLRALYHGESARGHRFVLKMAMRGPCCTRYGCPARLTLDIVLPHGEPFIEMRLQWFNKNACRLPEASWFAFSPRTKRATGWVLDKMGRPVSPLDVVKDGNRRLHAVADGVRYEDGDGRLRIRSLDAALVAPGAPSLLDFGNRQPALRNGVYFNLHNNIWGTNFPMWYDEDALFRFALSFR